MIHGALLPLLVLGLLASLTFPPLASAFAAILTVWTASVIAAYYVSSSLLGDEGAWCFTSGFVTGLGVAMLLISNIPGVAVYTVLIDGALLAVGAHVDFSTAGQCKVYGG